MKNQGLLLGVNIDHIATLRQARGTSYPDPLYAAMEAELGGADGITLHLREDRRHIQDRDVLLMKEMIQTRMNLEMAVTEEMLAIATKIQPAHCCLVPEKREELTTEGGLNVIGQLGNMYEVCQRLADATIEVSLFIDPEPSQIDAAVECRAPTIELHTGAYANAPDKQSQQRELDRICRVAHYAKQAGLIVNVGHGLHYHNVQAMTKIPELNELNIGHAIVARACFSGMRQAVQEMKQLLRAAEG